MAEYRLTPAAVADLEEIWTYTCNQWGSEQANRYTTKLISAIETLTHTPKLGPSCDHIRTGYRWSLAERHVVYYRITDYGIAVVRILHERMDATRHL